MERKKDGALLKTDSSLKVWVTVRGARLHVPNEPAFEEAGYRWEDVQVVSPEVLALLPHIPPDGTLLREFGNPAVYLIRKGLRWWVKDEDTLVELMDQPDVDGQVIWVPRDATRDIEFGGMYPLPFLARPLLWSSALVAEFSFLRRTLGQRRLPCGPRGPSQRSLWVCSPARSPQRSSDQSPDSATQ